MSSADGNRRGPTSPRIRRAGACLLVILCGLALRRYGLGAGLPTAMVKYGGSILWGTMVFFVVATAASPLSRRTVGLMAVLIAIGVELFRLVHTPWLDDFRMTIAGALLLGRIFSAWNLLAYGAGIGFGMLIDRLGITPFTRAHRTP
jgi:hypothetical protein